MGIVCARPVARMGLDAGAWALLLPPGGMDAERQAVRGLVGELAAPRPPRSTDGPIAVTRVDYLDSRLGPVVLVACHGRAVLYCRSAEITARLADALSVLAPAAVTAVQAARGAMIGVRVTRTGHLPVCLHPALITAWPARDPVLVTAHVCAHLVSSGTAAALGVLCTAYACSAPDEAVPRPPQQGPAG